MWFAPASKKRRFLLPVRRRVPHSDVQRRRVASVGPVQFLDMRPRLRQLVRVVVHRGVARPWQPPVAVVRHPLPRPREFAADHHRRMRLLHRLRIADDGREVHPAPVELRRRLRPQLLHRVDILPRLRPPAGEVRSQHFRLALQPARSDAEDEPPARHQVQRRHFLGQPYRIPLRHQTDARTQLDRLRSGRRCC